MVFPVHLQRSAVAAILDCPVRHQFTGPESLKPVALQLIWLFQESLLKTTRPSRSAMEQIRLSALRLRQLGIQQDPHAETGSIR